ncbi:nucleoside-triphosphatase, RNA helicase [Trachipleistophora hominis]|uniref:Nucleoside-triphosphatase, RNA helicase n=1 Tax=Trachipleistophora hominis TaxID=72359 RepID=L7JUZ7_TRAHO|nr:nucleoside-triphosphatase, RNA helicase [Trachipleistophora hominis]
MSFDFNDEQIKMLEPHLKHLSKEIKEKVIRLLKRKEFLEVENIVSKKISVQIFNTLLEITKKMNENADLLTKRPKKKKSEKKKNEGKSTTEKSVDEEDIKADDIEVIDLDANFSKCNLEFMADAGDYAGFNEKLRLLKEKTDKMLIGPHEMDYTAEITIDENIKHRIKNKLPIHTYEDEIIRKIRENKISIIEGETGCGKTTQIPKMLLKYYKKIIISLPRRMAAINIARRVSEELCVKLGDLIGYKVRFDSNYNNKTRVLFVTDGILSLECLSDSIKQYDVIVLDEFHERKMEYDFIISYFLCKNLSKLVLMSATINSDQLTNFFNAGLVKVPIRPFSNTIYYLEKSTVSLVKNVCETISVICNETENGDILVFLPGMSDILAIEQQIRNTVVKIPKIIKLYASVSYKEQMSIFEKCDNRKVILSTNIAESSITVNNLTYVIDSGLVKKQFLRGNAESLEIVRISKSQADQRAGRVGRIAPGFVFRMYTSSEYDIMEDDLDPEIVNSDISHLLLKFMKCEMNFTLCMRLLGYQKIKLFKKSMIKLLKLGCIDKDSKITQLGEKIHKIPLKVEMSKTLLKAIDYGVFEEVAIICSVLSVKKLFYDDLEVRKSITNIMVSNSQGIGDHISYLKLFIMAFQQNFSQDFCKMYYMKRQSLIEANKILDQLKRMFKKDNEKVKISKIAKNINYERIIQAFCEGYLLNIAKKYKNFYLCIFNENEKLKIHPSSSLFDKEANLIFYERLQYTNSFYMVNCCKVQPSTLLEFKDFFRLNREKNNSN